jgi:DNA-binding transcriptional ArsR family regulator
LSEKSKKMQFDTQLTKEEMKRFMQTVKNIDHTKDHKMAYRTMMNPTRREILKFIGKEVRKTEEIKDKFDLDDSQLKYHLSMLKQVLYILDTETGWKSTPRGIGFLTNARLSD